MTLDEVIKAFEECIVPKNVFCNGCYKEDRCKITEVALTYLKEYQRDKHIFAYDIAKRNLELSERNEPLTWDELKTLNGKPVWLELTYPGYQPWCGWEVIDHDGVNEKWMSTYRDDYNREQMGKTWQAYRKERE